MDSSIGQRFKGYELRERVGAGRSGVVYRASQAAVGREVAIKVILPQYANHPEFVRRFEVEAQLVARLEHPHIVPLYDYWRDPEGAYLVMRWLPRSLRMSIQKGAWSPAAVARLLEQLSSALAVAHRDHVIHRDIKPDNILLDEDDNAYLADFSIARDLSLSDALGTIELSTSPAYSAPEQIRRESLTTRTDLYSLGIVIYELLIGAPAFPDAGTPEDYQDRQLHVPLPPLSPSRSSIPAALDEVLQTATAKDPNQRYANVERFAAAFRAALPMAAPSMTQQPLSDPLTERELDVLRLMVDDLSNDEIAEKLFLSRGTVKWYVKQIYSKLDVHTRSLAIERARRLKLVESPSTPILVAQITSEYSPAPKAPAPVLEPANPYKGLYAFQEADAPDFFGRAALVERLLNRLSERDDDARLLVLVGPSGSGKSSVVKAGLIPALRQGGLKASPGPFIAEMLPGTHPLEELEAALMHVAVNSLPGLLVQLQEDRRGLVRAAKRILPSDPDTELILVIDQFEELFTLTSDEAIRSHFIDNLLSAVTDPRGRVRLILTLRADFYDRPLLYPRLGELVRTHTEVVLPLTARELEQAIQGPAERAGVQLEAGLVSTLVNQVGEQPGTLPLLEYALTELFEKREGLMLTLAAYQANGGVMGALAQRADELYKSLDDAGKMAVRQLFLRLITLGEGAEDTRRRVLQAELSSLLDENRALDDVLDLYGQYRLLTFDRDLITRGPTVEIAHEALIREWGQLREWLSASRDALRVQRRLMISAEEWLTSGKEPSFLALGARLTQFEALAQEANLRLNDREREYLTASIGARDQQAQAEAKKQAYQRLLERRSRNVLRVLVIVLLVATLGAFGLTGVALSERNQAETSYSHSEQQRLALLAQNMLNNQASGNVVALLALRSLQYGYSQEADAALLAATRQGMIIRRFTGQVAGVRGITFSPDGTRIASAGQDDTARIWDAQTGAQLLNLTGHTGVVQVADYSPDGKLLATSSDDQTVRLWNAETGAPVHVFTGETLATPAFSPSDDTLLTSTFDGKIHLWDVATDTLKTEVSLDPKDTPWGQFEGNTVEIISQNPDTFDVTLQTMGSSQAQCVFSGHTDAISFATFSPDGKYVLTGSNDDTARLWRLSDCTQVLRIDHDSAVTQGLFSPDGRFILTGTNSGVVKEWDASTGQEVAHVYGSATSIVGMAISPDGSKLITPEASSDVLMFDLTFQPEPRILKTSMPETWAATYAPDGKTALLGGPDMVERWAMDGDTPRRLNIYTNPPDGLRTFAFSPDGRLMFVTPDNQNSTDFAGKLMDLATGQILRQFPGHTALMNFVDYSPDGTQIVTSSFDMTAGLWDVATGKEIQRFVGHTGPVGSAMFSPDGKQVVTASPDGTARIWDAATGKQMLVIQGGGALARARYSPDGRTIATGDFNGLIKLWDAQTGALLHTFTGHTQLIWGLTFSRDGGWLASSSYDGTIRIWDVASGGVVRILTKQGQGEMGTIDFSPDGKWLLSSEDGAGVLWTLDLSQVVSRICAELPGDFTSDQRIQFNIVDQTPTCPQFTPAAEASK